MKIKIYMDEDAMSSALVKELRARLVDVITVGDVGLQGYLDEEQLDYATSQSRVLYTCNIADFLHLHTEYLTQRKNHAGIILVHQQRYHIGEQMQRVLRLIARKSAEEMHNHLEFLSNWSER